MKKSIIHKIKKIIMVVLILFISLTIYNDFTFNKSMEEGKNAVLNKNYNEAKQLFEKAVNKKRRNREAVGLYKQTDKLIQVIKLDKEGYTEEAIELCKNINNIHSEDILVQKVANNLKKEYSSKIEKENEYENNLNIKLQEAKALVDNFDYGPGEVALKKIIEEIKDTGMYEMQLQEAQQYLKKCK